MFLGSRRRIVRTAAALATPSTSRFSNLVLSGSLAADTKTLEVGFDLPLDGAEAAGSRWITP